MIGTVDIKKMHHREPKETERAAAHKVAKRVKGRRLETLQALNSLADRRKLVELERKLSRETHNVKALSRRVKSKETAMAAAEPWMLDT